MIHALQIGALVVAALLAGVVLLQQRGTSIGGAFGTDVSVYRSLRGVEKFLFFATIVLAVVFGAIALLLLWFE